VREERIQNKAIVDAYGPEEQALGWYYYLENQIRFPFPSRPAASRPRWCRRSAREKPSKSSARRPKMRAPGTCWS
jgi:Calcium binding